MEANELDHLRTHKPANIYCDSCMRGKMRQVAHRRGSFARPCTKWGDCITLDHMIQTEEDWTVGCEGPKNLLTVKDLTTGLNGLSHGIEVQRVYRGGTLALLRIVQSGLHLLGRRPGAR